MKGENSNDHFSRRQSDERKEVEKERKVFFLIEVIFKTERKQDQTHSDLS